MAKLNRDALGHLKAALRVAGIDLASLDERQIQEIARHLQAIVTSVASQPGSPFEGLSGWPTGARVPGNTPRAPRRKHTAGKSHYKVAMRQRMAASD